ncbi:MAG: TerC family protein [Rickettsiales bacterium]
MEWMTDYQLWASFLSLAALEIVLGVDNVVFIALTVNGLPESYRKKARTIGLVLALGLRVAMLFGIVWIMGLTEPWLTIFGKTFSGKDFMMFGGGLFLMYKATVGIHEETEGKASDASGETLGKAAAGRAFSTAIMQIAFIDLIFSFDSIMTAVGLTDHVGAIVAAMTVAMLAMLFSSGYLGAFIAAHPTVKMLALAFVMLVGVLLVAEGFGAHVPKGYIYFGMAFSLAVEILNMRVRAKKERR